MSRIQLTRNFYLDEFTRSEMAVRHGITIEVVEGDEVFNNLKLLCEYVLQPMRDALGPVTILSGVRPKKLNTLIGGSKKSQHIVGLAADFVVSGYTPLEVAQWIYANCELYDQVIHEFGQWVHASVPFQKTFARYQVITAFKKTRLFKKPKTVYVSGLLSIDEARRMVA